MTYGAAVLTPPATPEPSQVHLQSSGSQDCIQHPDSPQRHHQRLATKVNAIDHQHHQKIFRQLGRINLSAARSLEEGLEETLTVQRLGIGAVLRRKSSELRQIIPAVHERDCNSDDPAQTEAVGPDCDSGMEGASPAFQFR
jgi:hypothetical protein